MTDQTELSEREIEILRLVATGASNKEIAQRLVISPNTVKVHLRNIFAKIGVVSRTEATLFAIRNGFVLAPDRMIDNGTEAQDLPGATGSNILVQEASLSTSAPQPARKSTNRFISNLLILIGLAAAIFVVYTIAIRPQLQPAAQASQPVRWERHAPIPDAQSGSAAVVYNGQIYALSGETPNGISGEGYRYDPTRNQWSKLPVSKPVPVADASAALIGERIYIPGGRTVSGQPTNILEIFDPRHNRWLQGAAMPKAISAYALVAFEGKLYLFGGWDGQNYLNTVYQYDPVSNTWRECTAMPTARAYAGAAVAKGEIYVIGGYDGKQALKNNESYIASRDDTGENPWEIHKPLPAGNYSMGVVSLADMVYVIGGVNNTAMGQYLPSEDQWIETDTQQEGLLSSSSIMVVDTFIYVLGGRSSSIAASNQLLSYEAIYTISLPIAR